ncbi:MAG TPA: hypothetical protein GXX55_05855 [Firmicutes bacterium]|nr:hypothetical protein [Bacillota bacterium]
MRRHWSVPAALVVPLALLAASCGGGGSVSTFRIKNVDYRILGPATPTAVKPQLQQSLRGRFWVTYEKSSDVTMVVFEYKHGQADSPQPWVLVGEDPDLDGRYEFDSSGLGQNWITIRGTATTKDDAKRVVDQRTVHVDNIPPFVSIEPRWDSVLNRPPSAIIIALEDSSGINLANTSVELHANGGPPFTRTESEWEYGGNGRAEIRLVPEFWPDGLYEVVINPEDKKGNLYWSSSWTPVYRFTMDRSIAGSPPTITFTGPSSGIEVRGVVELQYTCSPDVIEVRYDFGFVPHGFRPGLDDKNIVWHEGRETDLTIDGRFEIDTNFTGLNWVAIRLFARSSSGLTAVSNLQYYQIRNL